MIDPRIGQESLFFLATFLVGRPAETRLYLPFAGLLAIAALPRWLPILTGSVGAHDIG